VQAANALAETNRQYRLLAQDASDLEVLTSPDRVITWISPPETCALGWVTQGSIRTRLVDPAQCIQATRPQRQPSEVIYSGNQPATPEPGYLIRIPDPTPGPTGGCQELPTPVTDESGDFVGVVAGPYLEAHARPVGKLGTRPGHRAPSPPVVP